MSQINVSIAASGDDARRSRTDTVYPPVTNPTTSSTLQFIDARKAFATPNYIVLTQFLRFDTSLVPDDATITSASLRLYGGGGVSNADTRNLNFEYYAWTPPPGDGDWAAVVGTTANVTALSTLSALGNLDFALSSPDANISKTGYTGIRFGIDGGAPTGENQKFFYSWDEVTNPEPILTVTYTEFMGSASAAWLTA